MKASPALRVAEVRSATGCRPSLRRILWPAAASGALLAVAVLTAPLGGRAQPSVEGEWTTPQTWPVVAVHAVVLPTGKVLHYSYPKDGSGSEAWLWDPATNAFTEVSLNGVDLFCSGQALLGDGRVFVTGGTDPASQDPVFLGIPDVYTFDPFTETWTRVGEMAVGRWYPTNVALPDGRMLIFSGLDGNGDLTDLVESYDPATNVLQVVPGAERFLDLYPRLFLLPSGKIFHAGPEPISALFDPATNTWQDAATSNFGYRGEGTAVLLALEPPDYRPRVLIAGGSPNPWGEPPDPATNTAEIIDLGEPNPTWRYTASMAYGRQHLNAVLLPDGTVLVIGGTASDNDETAAVYAAELFDPVRETWTVLASMQRPRMYHSSAVLLPDGRVLVAGTDGEFTAEIFSPPYLFQGPRPQIASAPTTIVYGDPFSVNTPDATDIDRAVLVRPGAATHSTNLDQRLIVLELQPGPGADELTLTAPPSAAVAPPGYYMLFLLDASGVPSVARFVRLQAAPDAGTAATFRVDRQGNVYADRAFFCGLVSGCFNAGPGADLAERIDVTESVEPGDVIEIDPDRPKRYRRARGPYSPRVVGVIATAPAITLGNRFSEWKQDRPLRLDRLRTIGVRPLLGPPWPRPRGFQGGTALERIAGHGVAGGMSLGIAQLVEHLRAELLRASPGTERPLLALMGRVYVKATAANGPIRPGDLLTTAEEPGYAMRCPDLARCEGAILGKALSPLESGRGVIEILLLR